MLNSKENRQDAKNTKGKKYLPPDAVKIPIDGILDLHTFLPAEVKDLVPEYLDACLEKGITEVRIIHGKGIGTLRRTVHAILDRYPATVSYRQAEEFDGSWGVTIVKLQTIDYRL